jgi:RND superfamily putative drug exporter
MASAIILDVTLVRALLVPALMKILGRAAWYGPGAGSAPSGSQAGLGAGAP